jgi:ATP-dependent Clp protease, protease subunit
MTEENENNYCKIFERNECKIYDVYLNEMIDEIYYYNKLIQNLNNCSEDDIVNIHINNFGGYISTAIQIINALLNTKAKTITYLEGVAYSAASMIFLCGDERHVSGKYSALMCHNYSGIMSGKGHEINTHSKFNKKYFDELLKDIYKDFLTKKEIKEMINGKDFWFYGNEIVKRLK